VQAAACRDRVHQGLQLRRRGRNGDALPVILWQSFPGRAVRCLEAPYEAFLWSERRKADKTALVKMHGNTYQVDAWLVGRMAELVFCPFDLDHIEVRLEGKPAGTAVPFTIRRHRHPKTRTGDDRPRTEPEPTGIDYLGMLDGAGNVTDYTETKSGDIGQDAVQGLKDKWLEKNLGIKITYVYDGYGL
jgi:hypothetical protein